MGNLKLLICSLCLMASVSLSAQQQEEEVLNAGELLSACQAETTANFCNTFIVTLVQTVTAMQEASQQPGLFCIDPQIISLQEVRQTIVNRLLKMPERSAEPAYPLVSEILHHSYPCNSQSL